MATLRLKHWRHELLFGSLAICAVALSSALILSSLTLHLSELRWQLQKSEFLEGNLSRMYLVARFVDMHQLYRETIHAQDVDEREYRISTILDRSERVTWKRFTAPDLLERTSLMVVNGMRSVTGKPALANNDEVSVIEWLDLAFRWERGRDYRQALSVYERLTPTIQDRYILGMVKLHQGFCNALLGNVDDARHYYEEVVREQHDNDLGVTASLLLQHLETLLQDRLVLMNSGLSEAERAKKMPMLLQCAEVLKSISTANQPTHVSQAEVNVVRGQCHEEAGEREQALRDYMQAISIAGNGAVSRDANRRMFMIGNQVQDGGRVKAIAMRLNETLQDSTLGQMLMTDRAVVYQVGASPELRSPDSLTLDTLARQADEVIRKSQQVKQVVAPVPAKDPLSPGAQVQLILNNGKAFSGVLLSAPDEPVVRIRTMIGVMGVDRKDVKKIIARDGF